MLALRGLVDSEGSCTNEAVPGAAPTGHRAAPSMARVEAATMACEPPYTVHIDVAAGLGRPIPRYPRVDHMDTAMK